MEEEICVLTPREQAAFKQLAACKAACEQVVHSVVREWETVQMAEQEVWGKLTEKYNLDTATHEYYVGSGGRLLRRDPALRLARRHRKAKLYADRILGGE